MDSLLYSLFAGVSTVFGAILVIFLRTPGKRVLSGLLGFAGGVMLAIALFDLIPEALEFGSMLSVALGFLFGAGIMFALDRFLPHAHVSAKPDLTLENVPGIPVIDKKLLRLGYLVFFGLALHNVPEGLAIGAGLESSPQLGISIAIAIGLHNIPEGIAVAGILRSGGMSIVRILLLTLAIGLMTPVGAAIGLLIFNISPVFISGGMAFAAGAMVYIVNDELIPQSHRMSNHIAIVGLILGLLVVMIMNG